jgi:hypothetical protein
MVSPEPPSPITATYFELERSPLSQHHQAGVRSDVLAVPIHKDARWARNILAIVESSPSVRDLPYIHCDLITNFAGFSPKALKLRDILQ